MRLFIPLLALCLQLTAQTGITIPATGRAVPELAAYDAAIRSVMQKWAIPGASVAITDQGRLVYARGFGFADRERGLLVQPASVFRMASISKTLTGMTILRLIQEGRFALDSRALDLIPNITPIPGIAVDPRTRQITVQQLLQHTGGWAKEIPDDASLQFTSAARALNVDRSTITPDHMARFAISQGLDFAPGTRYYYSQTGYLLLGRIIERITGKKYEDAVKEKLLTPAGAAASFKIGKSLFAQKEPDEVRYYNFPGASLGTSAPVVPGTAIPFDRQYGNYWVEQAEAYGGWIGNAIDVMKYINALEGRRGPALLSPASLASIGQRPVITGPGGTPIGLTWRLTALAGGQFHWWHSGGAVGTRNLLARRQNNRDWVVLMNMRPQDEDPIITDLFNAFSDAETRSPTWPSHDLFSDFAGPALTTSAQALTFRQDSGAGPSAEQLLNVASASPVAFTIALPTARWLKLDRLVGTTPATIRVTADSAGLDAGTYESVITIAAPQTSNGTANIRVTFTVSLASMISAIQSSATLQPITEAAPGSRITLEAPRELPPTATVSVAGIDAEIAEISGKRVDLVVPVSATAGEAIAISIQSTGTAALQGSIRIVDLSPAIFTARPNGPRTVVLRSIGADAPTEEAAYLCEDLCQPVPIDLGAETDSVMLRIPITGTRSQPAVEAYVASIGDEDAKVISVEAAVGLPGVDWITIAIPRSLVGRGEASVAVQIGEKRSNEIKVMIQ